MNLPQRSGACKGPKCGPTLRSPSKEGIGRSRNPSRGSQGTQGSQGPQGGRVPIRQVEQQEARATDGCADDLLEDSNGTHALNDTLFGSREHRPQDSSPSRPSDSPSLQAQRRRASASVRPDPWRSNGASLQTGAGKGRPVRAPEDQTTAISTLGYYDSRLLVKAVGPTNLLKIQGVVLPTARASVTSAGKESGTSYPGHPRHRNA